MEFLKNISSRTLLLIVHQVAMLITLIYLAAKLDLESFGIVSSGLIFYQVSYVLTEWGFSIDSLKKINILNFNNSIVSNILVCKFIIFLAIIFVFFIFQIYTFFKYPYLIECLLLAIFISSFNNLWFFQAINKSELLIFPTLIGRLLGLLIIFILVKNESSIYWVFISQSIAFFFAISFGYFYMYKKFNFYLEVSLTKSLSYLKESSNVFFTTLFQNHLHTIWAFFVLLTTNPIQTGFFNFADSIIKAGNAFNTAFTETLITNKISLRKKSSIQIAFFCFFTLSLLGVFFIEYFLNIFFEDKFNDGLKILQLSIISWFFISMNKILGYPILGETLSYNFVNKSNLIFAFFHLIIILVLVIFFKISALLASQIFLFLIFCNFIFYFYKYFFSK